MTEEEWIREHATVIDGEATEVETSPPASNARETKQARSDG
jgi:hypothetical protein